MSEPLNKKVGNIVEGPMGYKMPEKMARLIESESKGLPKDFEFRRLASPATEFQTSVDSKTGAMTDVSMVTTDDVDRDKEVVLPGGLDLAEFRASPTTFFQHDYSIPTGACDWIRPKSIDASNGLAAQTRYAMKPKDHQGPWFPSGLHSMRQQGICTASSIGFLPQNRRAATSAELSERPEWKSASFITDRGKLYEYSQVGIGCNPKALTLAVSKTLKSGFIDLKMAEFIAKSMGTILDPSELAEKAGAKYQHLNFVPPSEVQNCMRKGLQQHDGHSYMDGGNGGTDCATPEQLAMAKHLCMGGKASPGYVRKLLAWHQGPGATAGEHADGTPMHTLSLLHGQVPGKQWATKMCKDMDSAGGGDQGDASGGLDALGMSSANNLVPDDDKAVAGPNGTTQAVGPYVPAPDTVAAIPPADRGPMPVCPKCMTNLAVSHKDDYGGDMDTESMKGDYVCDSCGGAFDKPAEPTTKAAGGVALNREGFANATALIGAGKVTADPWSFTAADRHAAKPEDYLATDGGAAPDTAGHWKYPVVKGGSVNRRGVAAAESRASALNAPEIADAAKKLMDAITAHDGQKRAKAIALAESIPFTTVEQIQQKAVADEILRAKADFPSIIKRELHEAYARATGKV